MTHKQTFNVNLADSDHESVGTLPVRVEATDFVISIYPKGYGDADSNEGHGCPVSLEFHQGTLRLIVFLDINSDEATIINLSGAKEDRRVIANT